MALCPHTNQLLSSAIKQCREKLQIAVERELFAWKGGRCVHFQNFFGNTLISNDTLPCRVNKNMLMLEIRIYFSSIFFKLFWKICLHLCSILPTFICSILPTFIWWCSDIMRSTLMCKLSWKRAIRRKRKKWVYTGIQKAEPRCSSFVGVSSVNVIWLTAHTHWYAQLFCSATSKRNSCKPRLTLKLSWIYDIFTIPVQNKAAGDKE